MSESEITMIRKYLYNEPQTKTMLEWGCGGSTLYFSNFTKHYFSVEHDLVWAETVAKEIVSRGRRNICLNYIPNVNNFYKYIKYPKRMNLMWDFVLIDGRFRTACAMSILKYITPLTKVFFHDFPARDYYHHILEYYNIIEQVTTGQTLAVLEKKG
jgi:hypothetical protein